MSKIKSLAIAAMLVCSTARGAASAPESSPAGAAIAPEWRPYVDAMLQLGEKLVSQMQGADDPTLRQELYRQLFIGMSMAYIGLFVGDAAHPDFRPFLNQAYNMLAPNPDAVNYLAPIEAAGVYKISGYRGTVRLVDFQIGSGEFYTQGIGHQWTRGVGNHDIDSLWRDGDGYFEVVLSRERPQGWRGNWWPLQAEGTHVLVRQFAYDPLREVDAKLSIERLDTPAIAPRPSAEEIDAKLRMISAWAETWAKAGIRAFDITAEKGLINRVQVQDMAKVGGLAGQMYIEGQYAIEQDEALIYETAVPEACRYWNLQVTDALWTSGDYLNHQTSLNGYSARLDAGGRFRAVISAVDPGVPNWLDTGGHLRGSLIGRWTGCDSGPTPTLTRVKLVQLRQHLPADTPAISAQQRDRAIRLQRKGFQLRRRW